MEKDAIYRRKNHPMMLWRAIVDGGTKRFQTLTHPATDVADTTAFIINVSVGASKTCVHRRPGRGKNDVRGQRPGPGFCDGIRCLPLNFRIHSEKRWRGKPRKQQYKKTAVPGPPGNRRRQECPVD